MCKNAVATAANLMQAIEPTIKSLLTETNLINTPDGISAINAYNAALLALQGWQSGTASETVLELIGAFQAVFNTLPLPTTVQTLTNIILAGIETVIGVITANSPVPSAPAVGDPVAGEPLAASDEEINGMHVAHTIADTTAKVQVLVPGFKRSIWHSPESQYNTAWNKAVADGGFDSALAV
jgi:hypothetical protein